MNTDALFADLTEYYVIPNEPEPGQMARLVFRTAAEDSCQVWLITSAGEEAQILLQPDHTKAGTAFVWHEVSVRMPEQGIFSYCFKITQGEECIWYGRTGHSETLQDCTSFVIIPGFHTPGWAKGAVCYQIMVDRFCNGDPSNDVRTGEYIYLGKPALAHGSWEELPWQEDYREFYGGDLAGVLEKLDYLQALGVDVIYFNPLFTSPSSHKYDTQDYDHIDPHFGSDELFAQLVGEMHSRGMRVILDGVFNHCGSFHRWMDAPDQGAEDRDAPAGTGVAGAYRAKESPYTDYFIFEDRSQKAWPDNDSYVKWWGNETLPKLNYASEALRAEILRIAAKWVSPPYGADGWRLDVAADLGMSAQENHAFWKQFREAVRHANPDALIIAEHYDDPTPWLGGDEWDSVMNYAAFFDPVSHFFTGMEKHADRQETELYADGKAFAKALLTADAALPGPAAAVAMNQLSNHDHARLLTRTNRRVGRLSSAGSAAAAEGVSKSTMRAAVLFQMTWPGMPAIYYGDEAGMCGWTDPDNRRPYPWGHENRQMLMFHQILTELRHTHPALMKGSCKILKAGSGFFVFGRFTPEEQVIAAIALPGNDSFENASEEDLKETAQSQMDHLKMDIPVWLTGAKKETAFRRILLTDAKTYTTAEKIYYQYQGNITVSIPQRGGILLVSK